jgi:hypothetical protein
VNEIQRGQRHRVINMMPIRSRFSPLYIDAVFISGVLKLAIWSSISPVIFKASAEYLYTVNVESMIMPDILLSDSDNRSNY